MTPERKHVFECLTSMSESRSLRQVAVLMGVTIMVAKRQIDMATKAGHAARRKVRGVYRCAVWGYYLTANGLLAKGRTIQAARRQFKCESEVIK